MSARNIHFFSKGINFKPKQSTLLKQWLAQVAAGQQRKIKELNFIFCTDEYLLGINQQYLQHDTFTDIITFDNSEEPTSLEGDIFISVERTEENAQKFGVNSAHELHRVMAHGTLHLLGLKDKSKEEKAQMRAAEDEQLTLLATLQAAAQAAKAHT